MTHTKGEESEGLGWLNKVQVRWLGLAIKWGLGPTGGGTSLCLQRNHMRVHTYTCTYIHVQKMNMGSFFDSDSPLWHMQRYFQRVILGTWNR